MEPLNMFRGEAKGKLMTIFTIGFTKKSAEVFFARLKNAGVKRLIDIRLNNVSQLAGFSKKKDLLYFAKTICDIDYVHIPDLAPTKDILDTYKYPEGKKQKGKRQKGDWGLYERQFLDLMRSRHVEENVSREMLDGGCLLCSEPKPDQCHRRLVAEYLRDHWGDVDIEHIP
jgi:uncharacterized protein (DUF488 family)